MGERNFTKSNTPPWVFFMFLKLYKWYQIAQRITYIDPQRLKLLTRLHLGFSHLNEHRFRHNFRESMNPVCSCSLEIKDTFHYLLHCHRFTFHRIDLMNSVKSIYNK